MNIDALTQDPSLSIIPAARAAGMESVAQASLATWSVRQRESVGETHAPSGPTQEEDNKFREAIPVQYILQERVGVGAMGEVWRALQISLGRPVAVKRLRSLGDNAIELAMRQCEFRQEAMIAGLLEHPNIVPVHDLGVDAHANPLMCMKLVEGESWDDLIQRDMAQFEPEEFLPRHITILLALAQAVAFAHSRGIVHRDLKPSQVMVGAFGEVLLADWGLAICYDPQASPIESFSVPDAPSVASLPTPETAANPAGTPAFMAPEQTFNDARQVGPWTDVYLLGGTLYLLLTGTYPHHEKSSAACIEKARHGVVPPPAERAPGRHYPEPLVRLCMKALEREAGKRFYDGAEFLAALRDYISGAENRNKSRALVAEAAQLAIAAERGYTELSQSLSLVEDALRLWPENPRAATLREQILAREAEAAIQEGDLQLARITIERMAASDRRESLQALLQTAEHARRRAARERRMLRLATTVLLFGMLAGGAWFALKLSRERRTALAARDRAHIARTRAEDMLGFMIGDLRDRLESIGRLEVLSAVGQKATGYIDSLPVADLDERAIVQRVRTATQLAVLKRLEGDLAGSLSALNEQARMLQPLLTSDSENAEVLGAAGEVQLNRGQALFESGTLDLADEAYREAEKYFTQLRGLQPTETKWRRMYADAMRGQADNLVMRGSSRQGLEIYMEATHELEDLVSLNPGDTRSRLALGILYYRQATALGTMGNPRAAVIAAGESIAIHSALMAEDPRNALWQNHLAESHLLNGRMLTNAGYPQEGLDEIDSAMKLLKDLTDRDSDNMEWKSDFAHCTFYRGEMLVGMGDIAAGRKGLERAEVLARAVVEMNPSNAEWKRDLAQTLAEIGKLEVAANNVPAAAERYGEAVELVRDVALADVKYFQFRYMLDEYRKPLQELVSKLTVMGRTQESAKGNDIIISALETLARQEPGNTKFRFELAIAHMYVASTSVDRGFTEGVEDHIARARELFQSFGEEGYPGEDIPGILASLHSLDGRYLRLQKRFPEAMQRFEEFERYYETQAAIAPDTILRCGAQLLQVAAIRFRIAVFLDMNNVEAARAMHSKANNLLADSLTIQEGVDDVTLSIIPSLELGLALTEIRILAREDDVHAFHEAAEAMLKRTEGINEPRELESRIITLAMLGRFDEVDALIPQREKYGPLTPDGQKIVEEEREEHAAKAVAP